MPILVPSWLKSILKEEEIIIKDQLLQSKKLTQFKEPWSFSQEWQVFEQQNMNKTWSWTTEERLEQFFIETNTDSESIQQQIILDAGCGNGLLSKAIASRGAFVLAVDLHQSLGSVAQKLYDENHPGLCFLQADINDLPLNTGSIDLIISNGVLHHTPHTRQAFLKLAQLVKPGGKLYVWLYRKPFSFKNKTLLLLSDVARSIISRLPLSLQSMAVKPIARFFYWLSRIRKGRNSTKEYNDILIDIFDSLTPRYRHYHHPIEVAGWFHEAGFGNPVLSHWDDSYGFGMYAVKEINSKVPAGENYGKETYDRHLHLK